MRTVAERLTGAAAAGSNARQDLVRYLDIRANIPSERWPGRIEDAQA
jgi:hypothetical protein